MHRRGIDGAVGGVEEAVAGMRLVGFGGVFVQLERRVIFANIGQESCLHLTRSRSVVALCDLIELVEDRFFKPKVRHHLHSSIMRVKQTYSKTIHNAKANVKQT